MVNRVENAVNLSDNEKRFFITSSRQASVKNIVELGDTGEAIAIVKVRGRGIRRKVDAIVEANYFKVGQQVTIIEVTTQNGLSEKKDYYLRASEYLPSKK